MKLRNKKTGEIVELKLVQVNDKYIGDHEVDFLNGEKLTLKSLADSFNDVNEPLIKDEKIRKAVRAWAETNDITKINVSSSGYELWGGIDDWCIHFGGNPFKDIKPLNYTIDELCGEEE